MISVHRLRIAPVLLLAAALAACAGGKVVDGYDDPAYDGRMARLALLLPGLSLVPEKDEYARREIVTAMRARGFEVLTREQLPGAPASGGRLLAGLEDAGVDGVLVVMPGQVTMASRGEQMFVDTATGYLNFRDEVSQLFATGGTMGAEVRGDETIKELQVRLYPMVTGELAWERVLAFSNPGSWLDVVDRAAPKVAAEVARSGLVRQADTGRDDDES